MANNNNNWKRIGGFSRTGTQNYVRTNDAAMGGTTFGSTDVSNNVGNTTLRIGNNAGVVYINGDIDMSGGVNVGAPINRIRNVRDPIADQDVATKFYVDERVGAIVMGDMVTGPTGPEGPPGIGIGGQNGSDGPMGHTGPTGPLGATGSSFGVKGPTGERGGTGSTGANGAAGATGPIGPNGEKGEQGIQGIQGIQGSNGTILWLNPDGDSPTNQLITDSYLLSKVPINASIRTVGPISVSATYGNVNKIIPGSRFFNTAIEVSTLAVIPSGVWVLNLYANVPSNSDANQVALYAAVFMISGTTNQPSPDSLVIETKDGGDAGYYPPRAAYLPDHVKYIGKSWGSTDNVLISNTDTANKGVIIDGTSRKLYKLEMPVEFITLKDAAGNRENVYVQLQIYIRNTKEANQTANVSLYFQTDATTNETTYSYLQTTFGAVGIDGIPGPTGSTGSKGENGLIGPAGPAGATGSAGPTGIAGPVGPRGSQGSTGVTGPAGSSNSYGVQYAVQYRGNGSSTGYTDNSGNFRGDINFRYEPGPIGYVNRLTDASAGSVVLNDLACNSIHSPVYVQDTTISGPGTTRPRTYIRGGELVTTGPYVEQSDFVVLASGTDTTNGSNSKIAIGVNDITNGIKMVHNYQTKKVIFQVHDENKGTGKVGLQFDLNGSAVLGNVSAAQDRFCIVNSSGAVGVGGITAAQLSASTYTTLNRMLHVRGNIMVGSDPGGVNDASNAMVLLNKSTFTPSGLLSGYPGVYHRQIASGEVTALGGATNSIATGGEGLGFISPNFITFQTGSSLQNNSIVINQAGVVSVTGRTNLNGAVTVNKNFGEVETHASLAPVMDISGTLSVSTGAQDFTDVPRIKLISRGVAANSAIPSATTTASSNEIRGVSSNASTSGFLRLSAQTPAHSCIDLIGLNVNQNNTPTAYNNAVRISTGGNERMIVNGSGHVGIGTNAPTAPLDVNGITRIRNNLLANSKIFVGTTDTATNDGTEFGYDSTGFSIWNYRNGSMRFGTNSSERMRILGDGKVGIGTNAPSVALDVNGEGNILSGLTIGSSSNSSLVANSIASKLAIYHSTDARIWLRYGTSEGLLIGNNNTGSFVGHRGTVGELQITCEQNVPIKFKTTNTDRMTILGDGKVGIGTTAPSVPLEVVGNTILRNSVRIGSTTAPSVALDVTGAAKISGTLDVTGTSQFRAKTIQEVGIWHETSDGKQRFFYQPNASTYFGTGNSYVWRSSANNSNDTDIMTLLTSGRLGLGTTTPNTALDVNGRIRAIGGIKLGPNSTTSDDMTENSSLDINNSTIARSRFTCGSNVLTLGMSTAESFFWNESNTRMAFGTNNNRRMTISAAGFVGIGTEWPDYPVDIVGTKACTRSANSYWWGVTSSGSYINSNNIINAPISMRLNGSVWIENTGSWAGFWATSDRRIKKNINYNISSECLNLFRQLKCSNYSYIDERENKTNVYGYIAQDVSTVIPYAVTTQKGFIPSLYSLAKITKENGIVKITCYEQKTYTFHSLHDNQGKAFINDNNEPASDNEGGRHFKVKLYDVSMNEYIVRINELLDNGIFTIENDDVSIKLTHEEYFVYGQEVDDYKILNNESITIVASAALQEVDRQQQADKARIAELENQVSNLEATVGSQQSLINEILERLKNLEA